MGATKFRKYFLQAFIRLCDVNFEVGCNTGQALRRYCDDNLVGAVEKREELSHRVLLQQYGLSGGHAPRAGQTILQTYFRGFLGISLD